MGKVQFDEDRMGFDKWQMDQLLREGGIDCCIIPETRRLSLQNIRTLLKKHGRVYVKPTGSWGGANISLVDSPSNQPEVLWTRQGSDAVWVNLHQVISHYAGTQAIVQQAIPAVQKDGHPFDVRVHMQRDESEAWIYAGELVRVGGAGIVSNVGISHGRIHPFIDFVTGLFSLGQTDVDPLYAQLREIGANICHLFEAYPSVEEVGIDLAMDMDQRFWVIEVNINDAFGAPSRDLFRHLPDQRYYMEMEERAEQRSLGILALLLNGCADSSESSATESVE